MDRKTMRAAAVVGALAASAILQAGAAKAQSFEDDLRKQLRKAVRDSGAGDQLQALSAFGALPGISAATFFVGNAYDGSTIDRLILPLSKQFDGVDLLGGHPYAEVTFGYTRLAQKGDVFEGDPLLDATLKSRISTFSAIAGLGMGFELAEGLTLRPMGLMGYVRIEDDGRYVGTGAPILQPVSDGLLTNFTVDELIYGLALEAEYETSFGGDLNLTANARYNQLWGSTLNSSDSALEGSAIFGVLTATATVDGPTGLSLLGRELRWIGFAANSTFPGSASRAIDVSWFFELGAGIELVDREVVDGVEGVSLRGSWVVGDNVTGFSVAAQLEF